VIAILSCSCPNISKNARWEIQILADTHAAARLARLLTMACLVWAGEKKLHFWGSRILQTYVAAIHSMEEVWNFSLLQTKRRRQVETGHSGPRKTHITSGSLEAGGKNQLPFWSHNILEL
jgi:hypothetical protein